MRFDNEPQVGIESRDVDVGADELDLNIVAGYRAGTTMFVFEDLSDFGNDYQFYLCPPEALAGPAGPSPTGPISPPIHTAWMPVTGWSGDLASAASYYQPFYVDITPHLLPDIHPFHSPPSFVYPTNIFWQYCPPNDSFQNQYLYADPTVGIINPTGAYPVTTSSNGFNWIDVDAPPVFEPPGDPGYWMWETGPMASCRTQTLGGLTNPSPWCFLQVNVDNPQGTLVFEMPSQHCWFTDPGGDALRASMEHLKNIEPFATENGGAGTNLQSFLVWTNPVP